MKEVIAGVAKGVGQAVSGVSRVAAPVAIPSGVSVARPAVSAPFEAARVAAQTTAEVAKGIGSMHEGLVAAKPQVHLPGRFVAKADMLFSQGDSHKALSFLAFGKVSPKIEHVVARLPEGVVQHDFIQLERLGPRDVKGLMQDVEKSGAANLIQNPEMAQDFYTQLRQDIGAKKRTS